MRYKRLKCLKPNSFMQIRLVSVTEWVKNGAMKFLSHQTGADYGFADMSAFIALHSPHQK